MFSKLLFSYFCFTGRVSAAGNTGMTEIGSTMLSIEESIFAGSVNLGHS